MKILFIIITFITFILFFMEALIHFNIGKRKITKPAHTHKYIKVYKGLVIHIPDKIEFVKIFLTVLIFSSVSGIISAYIIKYHYI